MNYFSWKQKIDVDEFVREHIIYERLYESTKKANKYVYILAKLFGEKQYLGVHEVRQFFGVQYLVK